jgi:hypothetical protein
VNAAFSGIAFPDFPSESDIVNDIISSLSFAAPVGIGERKSLF